MTSNQSEQIQKAKQILDRAYTRYQTIFENTGTATILIEEDMTISVVNSELTRISGLKKEAVEGKMKFPQLIAEADRERVIQNHILRRKSPDQAPRNYPCRVKVADNKIKECILTVALITGTRQSVASITDISRQKHLEREIARISQEERQHMGQLLHDDLGSHLAGVEAMSSILAARLAKQNHADAGLAKEIQELVHQAIKKTRAMVRGLVPVNLEATGFLEAVKRICREVETAFGVTCFAKADPAYQTMRFSNIQALTHVYYIVRESVNNAVRHGNADTIGILFDQSSRDFIAEIRDNGKGMGPNGWNEKGFGLHIMQHRADLIGARLEIQNNPSGGTLVRCRIEKKYLL